MILSNRYGISEEQFRQLAKDGHLSTKIFEHDKVYARYLELKGSNRSIKSIAGQIAAEMNDRYTTRWIEKIISDFGRE